MKALLKLNDPEQFSSGLWVDPPKNQQALWKAGENIQFSDGIIEKAPGYFIDGAFDQTVSGVAVAYVGDVNRIYIGAGSKVYKREVSVPTTIGTGFDTAGKWEFEPYGTFLLATNNVDPPQIWKNTGSLADWPTCPFATAKLVRKLEVFPVLFSGQEVAWPSYNNFEDFVPGPGKRAGQYFLRDLDGEVMAAEPLGSSLVYYTQDMFGFMQFVGGEAAMSFRTQQGGGIGAVGPEAVVAAGAFHFGMSRKGIWQSDGSSFNYVAKPAISRWLQSQIDWTLAEGVVGLHLENQQQVQFYFTCLDGERRGLSYTYAGPAQGRWSILRMPITAASVQAGTLAGPIVGAVNFTGILNFGVDAGLERTQATLRTAPLAMGSTDRLKRWQMIEVHHAAEGLFEMRIGYSDNETDEPDWLDWWAADQENWLVDRESTFITIEFRSSYAFKLNGLEIFGEPVGRVR